MGLECFYESEELPKAFISILADGSGCEIFLRFEDSGGQVFYKPVESHFEGEYAKGVDKEWFIDSGYLWFVALPEDFTPWED